MNGFATAPPAIVFKIGVSTYKNPLYSRKFLKYLIINALVLNIYFTYGFIIISKYLCLNRV